MKALLYIFIAYLSLNLIVSFMNEKETVEAGLSGTVNPSVGYESTPWGTRKEEIHLSSEDTWTRHNGVSEVKFKFYNGYLYEVKDSIYRTTGVEALHERYGPFDEIISTEKGKKLYSNQTYNNGLESLFITLYSDSSVGVVCYDPLVKVTLQQQKNNTFQFDAGKWYTIASTDPYEQMEHYYFVKKNSDDEYVVLNYNKSLLSENRSTVRAGFTLGYGDYEIKINGNIQKKNYSTTQLKDSFYNLRWDINYSTESSSREMLDLILQEQPIQIRKSNTVYTFNTSGIYSEIFKFGISMEELDYALSNEEF